MALWAQFKAEMPRRWKNDSPLRFPYDKGIVFQKSFLLGRSVDLYPKIACKGTDNFSRCKEGVEILFVLTLESKSKDQRAKFKAQSSKSNSTIRQTSLINRLKEVTNAIGLPTSD